MTCPYRAATPWTNHWEAVQADVFVAIRTSIEFCEMISISLGYLRVLLLVQYNALFQQRILND